MRSYANLLRMSGHRSRLREPGRVAWKSVNVDCLPRSTSDRRLSFWCRVADRSEPLARNSVCAVRCCGAALRSSGRSRHRPRGATARRRRRCRRTRLPRSPVCRGERADAHRAGHSKKSIAIFAGTRTRASASSRTIAIPARRLMCAAVEVSRAGYYAWRERPDRARTTTNAALLTDIRVHQDSGARGRQPTGPCRAAGTGTWRHLSTAANFP